MDHYEKVIREYFDAWLRKDFSSLAEIFAEEIIYTESYGPEYHGLEQVKQWFLDWNKRGTVLQWVIKQILMQNNQCAVEWYFECNYDNNIDGFDGVSIVEFNDEGNIVLVKEFQSKVEHSYPYDNV